MTVQNGGSIINAQKYLNSKLKTMSILNDLFDFGKGKNLEKEIQQSLKGKDIKTTEIKKDGHIIINKQYYDDKISYHSTTTFIDLNDSSISEDKEEDLIETIKYYEEELQKALDEERFEDAATFRDKLKEYKHE